MIGAALIAGVIALAPGTTQSFESMTKVPADWSSIQYHAGVSTISIASGKAADGSKFVRLSAPSENHTRLFVPLKVQPNAIYKVSAQVRVTGAGPDPAPAVLALDGNSGVTTPGIPDDGQWRERDLYVRTGVSNKVKLVLSLGWFGNVTTGVADFDELKIAKVDAVPAGATAVADAADLNAAEAPSKAPARAVSTPAKASDAGPPGGTIGLIIVLGVLAAIAIRLLMHDGGADESEASQASTESDPTAAPEPEPVDAPQAGADAADAPASDPTPAESDADGRGA